MNEPTKKTIQVQAKVMPPCDCGNPNASWHGDKYGLRIYRCDSCYNYYRSGASNPWRGIGKDLRIKSA